MGGAARAESGGTLDATSGFPYRSRSQFWIGTRRAATTVAALTAFVLGVSAVTAAFGGQAQAGVDAEAGGVVSRVWPSGFAWGQGIRPGQRVLAVRLVDEPGGWMIQTEGAGRILTAEAEPVTRRLRNSAALGIGSLAIAAIALLLLRAGGRWTPPLTLIAVLLAVTPLDLHGDRDLSTVALAASAGFPAAWVATRTRFGVPGAFVLGALIVAFLATWWVARTEPWPTYDEIDAIRSGLSFTAFGAAMLGLVAIPIIRRELPPLSPLQLVDVVSLTAAAAVSVALVNVFAVSPLVIGGALLAAVAIYPRWRRTATVGADRLLLSDVRERAAIEATEEERARFARDLHDSPLQQLAGVIQRLEALPSAQGETETLRSVAQQLRAVATELRPPVLDDLGLVSALHFLADRASTPAVRVTATIDDRTGITPDERAPAAVELAIYRIAEEAVNNAIQHSRGTAIEVVGMVAAGEVELTISDNGLGLITSAVDDAARAGRLGLVSMRRRASLIGAELAILNGSGTTVALRWRA